MEHEHHIIRKDGEVRRAGKTAGVSKDTEGTPEKITGFVVDITRQKKSEDVVKKEEKLRQIVENLNDIFWLMSADKKQVCANRQTWNITAEGTSPGIWHMYLTNTTYA